MLNLLPGLRLLGWEWNDSVGEGTREAFSHVTLGWNEIQSAWYNEYIEYKQTSVCAFSPRTSSVWLVVVLPELEITFPLSRLQSKNYASLPAILSFFTRVFKTEGDLEMNKNTNERTQRQRWNVVIRLQMSFDQPNTQHCQLTARQATFSHCMQSNSISLSEIPLISY